jgi:serine/threonine protein kinase
VVLEGNPEWWNANRKACAIVGIVLGMWFLHNKGFIHRNLKASSIMFDEEYRVRIDGLEMCCRRDGIVGKIGFDLDYPHMAPEIVGGKYGSEVDIYAFGVLLYQTIVGKIRIGDQNRVGMMLRGKRPEIPGAVTSLSRELIESCWAQNSGDRPSFQRIWDMVNRRRFRFLPDVEARVVEDYIGWVRKIASDMPELRSHDERGCVLQ